MTFSPALAVKTAGRRIAPAAATFAALIALAALSGAQSDAMRSARFARNAAVDQLSFEGLPPGLAFANVALGGFRGVIADLLWLRAQRLQEAGRYVELVPLAEGISALEPDNGEVWAYQAWNLSFNVSAMMRRPEDRWRWVRSGIELLQSRGMAYNHGARPRRELSWFFLFKLGTDVDFAAGHYRAAWARELAPFLGPAGQPPAVPSLAASELESRFGLSAARMADLDARFGAMDWRVPASHAVYWAADGLSRATPRDRLPCRRALYQALVQMLHGAGRLDGDPADPAYAGARTANPAVLEGTLAFLRDTVSLHPTHGVRAAFLTLLLDAARFEVARGNPDAAKARYAEFADAFEPGAPLPSIQDVFAGTVQFEEIPWDALRPLP